MAKFDEHPAVRICARAERKMDICGKYAKRFTIQRPRGSEWNG